MNDQNVRALKILEELDGRFIEAEAGGFESLSLLRSAATADLDVKSLAAAWVSNAYRDQR